MALNLWIHFCLPLTGGHEYFDSNININVNVNDQSRSLLRVWKLFSYAKVHLVSRREKVITQKCLFSATLRQLLLIPPRQLLFQQWIWISVSANPPTMSMTQTVSYWHNWHNRKIQQFIIRQKSLFANVQDKIMGIPGMKKTIKLYRQMIKKLNENYSKCCSVSV